MRLPQANWPQATETSPAKPAPAGAFRSEQGRLQWQREAMPQLWNELERLDHRRRELAAIDDKTPNSATYGSGSSR